MKNKEIKINIPKGYEIDKENSTFECIKFKLIKKDITYKDVSNELFSNKCYYYADSCGDIQWNQTNNIEDANNATNEKQLEKLLALNKLLNIAEYYNRLSPKIDYHLYCIALETDFGYITGQYDLDYKICGLNALFNNEDDAQAVIDNPNFREILDTIYKY